MRIDHVQLAAPPGCEERAREFYGGLLGLIELPKPATRAARGGVWFAINATQQLHVGVDDAFAPARTAHPAVELEPDALDELAGRLTDAGVEVAWDDDIPSQRRFHVADPFGNRLELLAARGLASS